MFTLRLIFSNCNTVVKYFKNNYKCVWSYAIFIKTCFYAFISWTLSNSFMKGVEGFQWIIIFHFSLNAMMPEHFAWRFLDIHGCIVISLGPFWNRWFRCGSAYGWVFEAFYRKPKPDPGLGKDINYLNAFERKRTIPNVYGSRLNLYSELWVETVWCESEGFKKWSTCSIEKAVNNVCECTMFWDFGIFLFKMGFCCIKRLAVFPWQWWHTNQLCSLSD